jgi:hypothetical protein
MLTARALRSVRLVEIDHPKKHQPLIDSAEVLQERLVSQGMGECLVKQSVQSGEFIGLLGGSVQQLGPCVLEFVDILLIVSVEWTFCR